VLEKTAGVWSKCVEVGDPNGFAIGRFGESVDFDGQRLIVGAPADQHSSGQFGVAYVYDLSGAVATPTALGLTDGLGHPMGLGKGVAIDGDVAAVSA